MVFDHKELQRNLARVQNGVLHRAPGIRKCADCHEPYIQDESGLNWCPDCRVHHVRRCSDCTIRFFCTREGHTRCPSCRQQLALPL